MIYGVIHLRLNVKPHFLAFSLMFRSVPPPPPSGQDAPLHLLGGVNESGEGQTQPSSALLIPCKIFRYLYGILERKKYKKILNIKNERICVVSESEGCRFLLAIYLDIIASIVNSNIYFLTR